MILKRCFYIILSVWLINAVVCFHANDTPSSLSDHLQYPGENCREGNTILDFVAQLFNHDESADKSDHHHAKKFPRKILARRLSTLDLQLPVLQSFIKNNIVIDLHRTFGGHWLNNVFLPGYYNFLFRYKPF